MTQKGLAVLRALLDAFGVDSLAAVVVDREVGVKLDHSSEIARTAELAGIPVRARDEPLPPHLVAFAVGWRFVIHEEERLVVLHDSLLPRYRGFAPLVNALINGEPEIGVTALWAHDRYDSGPIVAQSTIAVSYPLTIRQAIDAVIPLYQRLAVAIAGRLFAGEHIAGRPQDEGSATYSTWRDDADYVVDWRQDSASVARFIDAVGPPYAGACSYVDGRKVHIHRAEADQDEIVLEMRHPGKVFAIVDGRPTVVCGEGLIRLLAVTDAATGETLLPWSRLRTRFRAR
jgi:methionyl-tRNA formyltransferase